MDEAWFRGWAEGVLRRPEGDSALELLRTELASPEDLRLGVDDDWLEEFELAGWERGRPVYSSRGFTPRI